MAKKEDEKNEVKIYSNYIIGIVALILSIFNPLPGLILGIVGLVRIKKQRDRISKKAKVLNMLAVIIGIILLALSIVLAYTGIDWGAFGTA